MSFFLSILGLVLLVLKLSGVIGWSWLWVLSPFVAIGIWWALVGGLVMAFGWMAGRSNLQ